MGARRGNSGQRVSLKWVPRGRESIFETPEKPRRLAPSLAGLEPVDKDSRRRTEVGRG
jgi:hypothetical protein